MSDAIQVYFEEVDNQVINKFFVDKFLHNILSEEGRVCGFINLIFCNDSKLHSINLDYLKHDTLTDIITFDYCEDFGNISGDIFISYERVEENALNHKTSLAQEIHRVIAHGLLHLLGYNDHTPEEKAIMRQKEDYYLNLFGPDVS